MYMILKNLVHPLYKVLYTILCDSVCMKAWPVKRCFSMLSVLGRQKPVNTLGDVEKEGVILA